MTRNEELINRLRALKPAFKGLGLKRVRVYGSVARGEAGPESDVDLLVDFEKIPGLIRYIGIENDLGRRLGCRADMVMEDALHPTLKSRILSEAQDV